MSIELLPSSLPKNPKIDWNLSRGGQRWFYFYCANCGCDGGRILETDLPENFGFYLCDENQNNCSAKWSQLAGTLAVPDEVFWQKVADAQMEKYDRLLTPLELAIQLQDESSLMSVLKKETR